MCVGGIWRVNCIGGLSNHAPRMVSGRATGLGAGGGVGTLAGMLCTVEPAVWRRVSKALLIGGGSTRCCRGGLTEGVTGGVTGGSCTGYGAGCGGALA